MHTIFSMKKIEMISKNMRADKAINLLARSMYKELINNGYSRIDVINFSRELINNINLEDRIITSSNEEYSLEKLS